MSTHQSVEQDERTVAVLGESGRLVAFFFLLALPIDMAYRSMVRHEVIWDLLVIYLGGAVVGTVYQARQKILGKTWVKVAVLFGVLGAAFGVILAISQAR